MKSSVTIKELDDNLAGLVDGDPKTLDEFAEAIADSDELRDAKHGAERAAELLAHAGDDFAEVDFEARVLADIDAADDGEERGKPASASDATPQPEPSRAKEPSKGRHRWLWAAVPVAAAAAIALVVSPGAQDATKSGATSEASGLSAKIVKQVGGDVIVSDAGRTLVTDRRTRAFVELGDGSTVTLGQSSELRLIGGRRSVSLATGTAIFEVEKAKGTFVVNVDGGAIEVLGTRFAVSSDDGDVSVRVLRGKVRLRSSKGSAVEVEPGQEGILTAGHLDLVPAFGTADSLSWAELEPEVEQSSASLGELRAKKPGDKGDDRPLTLAEHKVRVRIVGNVARTEIEQSFRNDTKATLEGIYSFPLPVDAQIESLALDVDDGFEQGAFVDRERAAKIWAGVIHNATPKQRREKTMEMIWVPGPWRDPALLEWQKGGSFDLRIFPIPAEGQRTIRLAYTQTLAPFGKKRRYVYPMAHSSDGSTAADKVDFDVRVAGVEARTVAVHGYQLARKDEASAVAMTMSDEGFSPSGDLIIDYALPGGEAALNYWSYVGEAAAAPGEIANAKLTAKARRTKRAAGKGAAPDPKVTAAQARLAADPRGYVLFALRPQLPAWSEHEPRDVALVVDSSQSMVGERYVRASRVVTEFIAEMDRRDRVAVFACDLSCKAMTDGFLRPNRKTSENVQAALASYRPAGSSNLLGALTNVSEAVSDGSRAREIVYIGDGIGSVGHRRASTLASATKVLRERKNIAVSTLGIGADADARVLAAVAAAGGGHYRSFVPGESAKRAAYALLESTYGARLTDAVIELPAGLEDVVPKRLPNLHSGEEVLVAARMSEAVKGEIELSGKVAGKAFSQRFPIDVKVVAAAGNAFVPRSWAALRVADLENRGQAKDRPEIVALSKAFAVMSRHTSLLVLESESMFSAFGVDRARPTVSWTGEEEAVVTKVGDLSQGTVVGGLLGGKSSGAFGMGGGGSMAGAADSSSVARSEKPGPRFARKAKKSEAKSRDAMDDGLLARERMPDIGVGRRGGQWMKRVRYTEVAISSSVVDRSAAVEAAQTALQENADSRDRHRAFVRALSAAGRLEDAEKAAEEWLIRDQLDAEALTYLSDALGRQGQRDAALRVLSGIVDLDPDKVVLHQRMIKAYRRAGLAREACAHEVALAEAGNAEATAIGSGVRCLRVLGEGRAADALLDATASAQVRVQAEAAAAKPPAAESVRGKLMVEGSWASGADLDLSIITPQGTRLSWMGGRKRVVAKDAHSLSGETLGLRRATPGRYTIEVSRTAPGSEVISGQVVVSAYGKKRTLSFELSGGSAQIGSVVLTRQWRMEAAGGGPTPQRLRVNIGNVQVIGSLDRNVVRRVLLRRLAATRRCVERDLMRGRSVPRNISVQLQIDAAGRVVGARVNPQQACIVSNHQRMRFPRPPSGNMTTVRAIYRYTPPR